MATTVGRAEVQIVADTRGFARDAEREINRALRRVDVDADPIARGIDDGIQRGVSRRMVRTTSNLAERFIDGLGRGIQGGVTGPPFSGAIAGAVLASLGPVLTVVGGGLGGALVAGFAAALGGLGIVLAAQNEEIQQRFSNLFEQVKILGERLAEPFLEPLQGIADSIFRNLVSPFSEFSTNLGAAFDVLGPAFETFVDGLLEGLVALSPAFVPLSEAFATLAEELAPTLITEFGELSDSLIALAEAVGRNPEGFVRLIELMFDIIQISVNILTFLTDFAGLMDAVRLSFDTAIDPVATMIRLLFDLPQLLDDIIEGMDDTVSSAGRFLSSLSDTISTFARDVFGAFTDLGDTVSDFLTGLVRGVSQLPGAIRRALLGVGTVIFTTFRDAINGAIGAINTLIRGWNNLSLGISGRSIDLGPLGSIDIPGFSLGTPNIPTIPRLQFGGEVERGGAVMVGEGGPEILQLPQGARVTPLEGRDRQMVVNVFIGDQQLRDIIDVQINNRNILDNIGALAGSGAVA